MKRTIFSRLLLSHIAVILVTTLTLWLMMTYLIRDLLIENKRNELLTKGTAAVSMIVAAADGKTLPENELSSIGDLIGANAWLIDGNGLVVDGTPPVRPSRRPLVSSGELDELISGKLPYYSRVVRRRPDPYIVVALPVPATSSTSILLLYAPITGVTKSAQAFERLLLISLFSGTVAAVILGYIISKSLTRPIENISQAANAFAAGKFDSRTSAVADNEIGNLGRVFNSMAESLANIEQNRRDFLANVSHELKTPIANIQALAETLQDGLVTNPEQQHRYLTTIVKETEHAGRLIGDLLDLSQLDAGELSIISGKIPVEPFLQEQLSKHANLFLEKNLTVKLDVMPNQAYVWADADRVAQIITNLLSNAVRYAPESSLITVSTERASASHLAFSVTDQGNGIPVSEQPHIWERFYRLEKSRSRREGGTGLGLAIVKKLVTAMGGEVSVHSQPGQGATFTFTLPIAK